MTVRLALLFNPYAGAMQRPGGAGLRARLEAAAQWADVAVRVVGDDAAAAAREACDEGADILAVAGGDGTARAVAEAAAKSACPVSVMPLPLGTTNLLPRRLYGVRTAEQILAEAKDYTPVRLHAGALGERYFFILAAAGFPSRLAEAREDIRLRGKGRRFLDALGRARSALGSAFKPSLKLYADGSPVYFHRASAVLVAPGGLDAVLSMGPVEAGRTQLECIAARPRHVFDAAGITVAALMRDWREHARVRQRWVDELVVRGRDRLPVMLDGEPAEIDSPAAFSFIPEAASFLAP
jgi:diacylglycerol kinase family enzyme